MTETNRTFCTAVNCMDGRAQLPVTNFMRQRFGADYVDMVTEPGPNLILAECADTQAMESIIRRVEVSIRNHGSRVVAVVGHHLCAGNPAPRAQQDAHTRAAAALLSERFPGTEVIGVWVDEHWKASELP